MTTFGKYELHEELGRGSFGTVYRATDNTLGRTVALKVLHPQLMVDDAFVERFRNEALALAALDSHRIVTLYDIDEFDGRIMIATRYLPGRNLKHLINEKSPLPYGYVFELFVQILEGVEEAHVNGLIHRDIKPENILLDANSEAVITDFGLAKVVRVNKLSASGGIIGTPNYIAPELWQGKAASPASDIYSMGCVLSELLTGKVLFAGDAPGHVMTRHLIEGPRLADTLPLPLRSVLQKALAKDPGERYQGVKEFSTAIDQIRRDPASLAPIPPAPAAPLPPLIVPPQPAPQRKTLPYVLSGVALFTILIMVGILSGWFTRPAARAPEVAIAPVSSAPGGAIPTAPPAPAVSNQSQSAIVNPAPVDPTAQPTATQGFTIGDTRVSPFDQMVMVFVPGGEFMMGSPDGVGEDDEHPRHKVKLDSFWIDRTEVTNRMYANCVNSGGCTAPQELGAFSQASYYDDPRYANYPVIYVNWNQAATYCKWVNRQLPSEAQWEYAAGGAHGFTYPWGNDFSCRYGNFDDETEKDDHLVAGGLNCDGYPALAPVGSFPAGASPFGALDMAGNVWEWVADWYGVYSASSLTDPAGPKTGEFRLVRGGSWLSSIIGLRVADRIREYPYAADYTLGFRCADSADGNP